MTCLLALSVGVATGCEQPTPKPLAAPRHIAPIHRGPPGAAGPPRPKLIAPPRDLRKPPSLAQKSPSGLVTRILRSGTGPRPGPRDKVLVHYTGWSESGEMFDSTKVAGRKAVAVRVDAAIAGWSEALLGMRVGEQRRLWVPESLAFAGAEGKPRGTVVFDVELLRVKRAGPVVLGDPKSPGEPAPMQRALSRAVASDNVRHCLRSQSYLTAQAQTVSREQAVELCYRDFAVATKDMHTCSLLGDDDMRLSCTNAVMRERGVDEKLSRL